MILKEFGYKPLDIKFSQGNHSYRLEGLPAPSVSAVIGRKDKDWKGQWMMKEAGKYIARNIEPGKTYSRTELDEIIKNSKKAYLDKSTQATDSGSLGHKLIEESIISGNRLVVSDIKFPEEQTTYEVRNIYANWLLWEQMHPGIEYLAVELILADKELWIAGTADLIAIIDSQLCLLDWKSSKQWSDDLFLQSSAYKYMLIKGGVSSDIVRRGVRLDKGVDADGKAIKDYVPTYRPENDIIIPSDYEKDLEAFKGLKSVDKWVKYINKEHSYLYKAGKSSWYVLNVNKAFNN